MRVKPSNPVSLVAQTWTAPQAMIRRAFDAAQQATVVVRLPCCCHHSRRLQPPGHRCQRNCLAHSVRRRFTGCDQARGLACPTSLPMPARRFPSCTLRTSLGTTLHPPRVHQHHRSQGPSLGSPRSSRTPTMLHHFCTCPLESCTRLCVTRSRLETR